MKATQFNLPVKNAQSLRIRQVFRTAFNFFFLLWTLFE